MMENEADVQEAVQETKKPKVLLLDDEVEILKALKRVLRKSYEISLFEKGEEALSEIQKIKPDLIISDMRMPGMDGATFLTKAKELHSNSKRILLTGYSDMESTVKAINDGEIYSYISKPWKNEEIILVLSNAYNLLTAEREKRRLSLELETKNEELKVLNDSLSEENTQTKQDLMVAVQSSEKSQLRLKKTYQQLIQLATNLCERAIGQDNGHAHRVAAQARYIAKTLKLEPSTCIHTYVAGLLHEVGKSKIDQQLLTKPILNMDSQQIKDYCEYTSLGSELLSPIPNFASVGFTIRFLEEHMDGNGYPDQLQKDEIPIASRILSIVSDFDNYCQGKFTGEIQTCAEAKQYLTEMAGHKYDGKVLKLYLEMLSAMPTDEEVPIEYAVNANQLTPSLTITRDVEHPKVGLILVKGNKLTQEQVLKLNQISEEHGNSMFFYVKR